MDQLVHLPVVKRSSGLFKGSKDVLPVKPAADRCITFFLKVDGSTRQAKFGLHETHPRIYPSMSNRVGVEKNNLPVKRESKRMAGPKMDARIYPSMASPVDFEDHN